MLSPSSFTEEKYFFEIFTKKETNEITESSCDPEIKNLILKLVTIFNNAMHNKSIGWYNKIALPEPLEGKETLFNTIRCSAKRYLETANKLQKPKEGQLERLFLPRSKKVFEKYVSVYQCFWEDCREALLYNFLIEASRKKTEELSDGGGKVYIYTILQLKNKLKKSFSFDNEKIAYFEKNMDDVIQNILAKTNLPTTFQLDKNEKNRSDQLEKDIFKRSEELSFLRKEFESNPIHAIYIHVRPFILIQYVQLIDYVLARANKIQEQRKSFLGGRTFTNDPLFLLYTKKNEIMTMFAFQKRLFSFFKKDDFIETLHHVIKNQGTKLLPLGVLFEYDTTQNIHIAEYENPDADTPPTIGADETFFFRNDYLKRHLFSLTETKKITSEKKVPAEEIIKTHTIYVIDNLKPVVITLPKIVPYNLPELKNSLTKQNSFNRLFKSMISSDSSSEGNLYHFFVTQAEKRSIILAINNFAELIQSLSTEISTQNKFLFLSMNHSLNPSFHLFKMCVDHLEQLITAIKKFRSPYQEEISLLADAEKKVSGSFQKTIFKEYMNVLSAAKKTCHDYFKKILSQWIEQINDLVTVEEPSNFIHLCDLIEYAVILCDDTRLTDQWNSTRKKRESFCKEIGPAVTFGQV